MCNINADAIGAEGREKIVSVAVDTKDKSSQNILRWAIENCVTKGQTLRLIHVLQRPTNITVDEPLALLDKENKEFFLPLRCFCMRRHIKCECVVLEDLDVAKALIAYITQNCVDTMLLGAGSKHGLSRLFKTNDIPGSILKWAPDFCNVYVISKGKLADVRTSTRPVPRSCSHKMKKSNSELPSVIPLCREGDGIFDDLPGHDSGASFSSTDSSFISFYQNLGSRALPPTVSKNFDQLVSPIKPGVADLPTPPKESTEASPKSSQANEDVDDEMRRLKLEMKQTMDMYHAACKEALAAKEKAIQLQEWRRTQENRLQEVKQLEEAATAIVEREKARYMGAIEAAENAQKVLELEVQKRMEAEMKALREVENRNRVLEALGQSHAVIKYQSLFHILIVLVLCYFYFSVLK